MNNNKSIARSKKSVITIAEVLAKEGLTKVVPGGGILYEGAKALFRHGKQYFKDRTENRLEEFHQALLLGKLDEDEFSEFIEKEFEIDDYYAILSSCVQDIENEKVTIYSQLMRSLIERKLEPALRRHFITSCRELSYIDICFLRELYINSKYDLMTVGGTAEQVKKLLSTNDVHKRISIERLTSRAFLEENEPRLTAIAHEFVNSIYSDEELQPEAIGRQAWTGIHVVITSFKLGKDEHTLVATEIQKALWKRQIKSSIHILDDRRKSASLFYSAGVLLVDNEGVDSAYIEAVTQFSQKRPLFRINIDSEASVIGLKGIEFAGELTLYSKKANDIRQDINKYVESIMA
jgi:hypothetical protein